MIINYLCFRQVVDLIALNEWLLFKINCGFFKLNIAVN
jgi:hypothetical protein